MQISAVFATFLIPFCICEDKIINTKEYRIANIARELWDHVNASSIDLESKSHCN